MGLGYLSHILANFVIVDRFVNVDEIRQLRGCRKSLDPTSQRFGFQAYHRIREACQLRLAKTATSAPEALAAYREQVDTVARRKVEFQLV